ncbi:MAG: hypothetical protein E7395_08325, partial [Ruminococcaceae bacterium]|nr:hypothetical protein [Oscillospiraceae bacterium]
MKMKSNRYTCFTANEYIGSKAEIAVSKKEEKTNFPLHWHDFFEIEIILGGNGTQNLNGTDYKLKRGCAYLLSPTDYHLVITEPQIELYNIMFHESLLSEDFLRMITEESTNRIFYFDEKEFDEILKLCGIMETEFKTKKKYKREFLKNLLDCFLIIFLRQNSFYANMENKSNHIQKALLYTQLHFKESPSLSQIAHVVNLNPNYFSAQFKNSMGKNYSEYLTSLKLSY